MAESQSTHDQPHRVDLEVYGIRFESMMDALVNHAKRESLLSDFRLSMTLGLIRSHWESGSKAEAIHALMELFTVELRGGV